jgi:CheY-like chemotaxis protein
VYQKFGLSIREQIRLPLAEDCPQDEESTEPELEPSNESIGPAETAVEAEPHSAPLPEMPTQSSHAASMQEATAESIRMMWGDRESLLHALSTHFDLAETKVNGNGNGRVQTRLYEKFGLHVREQIQIAPPEDRMDRDVSNRLLEPEEEVFGAHGGPSNGLINLADAMQPVERRLATVHEIAPLPSVVALIRKSLADLRELLSDDGYRSTIGEPFEDSAGATSQEPSVSPPPAVYGVLSGKRIALIGFSGGQMENLRRGFEDQFSHVLILDWSVLELAVPVLSTHDLIVLRLERDEDGRRLDGLSSVNKPTLLVGGLQGLIQLNPEYSGTPFDFVAPPFYVAEVVWRSANLLTRSSCRGGPAPAAAAAVEEDPPQEEDRKTVQAMIAEDDPATATLLETVLTSHGMECHVVRSGTDALEMAGAKQIDVAILEVGLPGLDGFQVLAALKRNPSLAKVRVVFLTARQSEADILRAFGLGADDYITKPFSPMEVAARLKRLLGRSR